MTERISVGLVACAATKAATPQPARALYRSELFRRASSYAEATYDWWFILSARHYLVHPDEVLAPYNTVLSRMPRWERDHWGSTIAGDLRLGHGARTEGRVVWPVTTPRLLLGTWIAEGRELGIERRADLWFHAGADYVTPVTGYLAHAALPFDVHTPLAGLGIGHQLRWYTDQQNQPSLF